jgi:hypothetical protein
MLVVYGLEWMTVQNSYMLHNFAFSTVRRFLQKYIIYSP